MGSRETKIIEQILLNQPRDEFSLRTNSGVGWAGKTIKRTANLITLSSPRPLHAMPAGWPDITGWRTITITPEMVGERIAVVRCIEVKTGKQQLSADQQRWRAKMLRDGCIYDVVRD